MIPGKPVADRSESRYPSAEPEFLLQGLQPGAPLSPSFCSLYDIVRAPSFAEKLALIFSASEQRVGEITV